MPRLPLISRASLALLCLLGGCMSLPYELADMDVPVLASSSCPSAGHLAAEPFSLREKQVLWVHGLFGHKRPDVRALVAEQADGSVRIENFRVRRATAIQDWLATHLSLGLVRIKTVYIEGTRVLAETASPSAARSGAE
jgi:hypothetical protein